MFLRGLRAFVTPDDDDPRRVERTISRLRFALASTGLIAITIDPSQPALYAPLAYAILVSYVLAATGLLFAAPRTTRGARALGLLSHLLDIAAGAAVTLFTDGPSSPFFVFLTFPLLTAAYRWSVFETLLSAAAALVALGLEVVLVESTLPISAGLLRGEFGLNRLIIRAAYLVISGIAVGYLSDSEKRRRRESAAISELIRDARLDAGLGGTLQSLLGAIGRTFAAERTLLIVQEAGAASRAFLLDAQFDVDSSHATVTSSELDDRSRRTYLFPVKAHSWFALDMSPIDTLAVTALDESGAPMPDAIVAVPAAFKVRHRARAILAVSVRVANEWSGRLLLLNPKVGLDREETVRFAQRLVRDIGPAVRQVSLLQKLRTRAERIERLRLARELHDGAIQSLSAAAMHLDVIKRRLTANSDAVHDIDAVEAMLRDEVSNLRDLTQDMRIGVIEADTPHLVRDLGDIVERFARQSDFKAQFVSDVNFVNVDTGTRRELLRILHEALVNVRKHSRASEVLVWLRVFAERVILSVEDNGHGFAFDGRLTLTELQARRDGPIVIAERVAALQGELAVESRVGRGARLEIRVPLSKLGSRSLAP